VLKHESDSKKVVVFGGSGFLGSHVADRLTMEGFDVTIFDQRTSEYLSSNQRIIVGSILDKDAVVNACRDAKYVYNFAGLSDINESREKAFDTAQLNILGNINILEGARLAKATRFVFASTLYVYSESGSFYRASKQASERFVELYFEQYGLPFTILRYGSLFGRRADDRNAIYRFVKSALTNGEISYKGTGNELREYIHCQDAAIASVEVLKPEFKNEHITITGQQALRVKDVLLMISEMFQNKISIFYDNMDVSSHYNVTPYAYKPRIGKKLVVNPFIDFGQGVLDCIHELAEKTPESSHDFGH
jgi:UDP-glucose 4-epimerase